jgi:radical SAM-linked protein
VALALPLGVEGTGEWLDLEFTEAVDPAAVRTRLQAELPPGLQLLSAAVVPTFGLSLSQELAEAHWQLTVSAPTPLPRQRWSAALADLLGAEVLHWSDTDKKGRPRERDCRPSLLAVHLAGAAATAEGPTPLHSVELRLEAAVDGAGRSLRPSQLAHWLEERLGERLQLGRQCRIGLVLREAVPA